MYFLGIDFGTSFTKAVVFDSLSGKYTSVKIGTGNNSNTDRLPTVAFFTYGNEKLYIGDLAINSKLQPGGVFFYNFKPEMDTLSPNTERYEAILQIVTEFFLHIKNCAEEQFKQSFDEAVFTVPASAPREGIRYQMMQIAARNAGFINFEIIPEPIAAAYYLLGDRVHSLKIDNSLFLICDFGGGTYDTSIIRLYEQQIQVIDESVGSDNQQKWGGIYIDSLIGMDFIRKSKVAKEIVALLRDKSQPYHKRANASYELTKIPVKAKEMLSEIEVFSNDDYSLTRQDFNGMIRQMVDNTIQCTLSLLESASSNKLCDNINNVKKVFLVGGTSQIPLVQSRWQFQKKASGANFDIEVLKDLNIVACGASRYRELVLSPKQLNIRGIVKAQEGAYAEAAAYFNNANDAEGLFFLGLLYYIGAIGHKRQPAKAYRLFEKSHVDYPKSNLMMALMRFNNDGVLRDDQIAKDLIKNLEYSELKGALERTLSGERNPDDLKIIYQFDAKYIIYNTIL